MRIADLPVVNDRSAEKVDVSGLRAALTASLEGEVRFQRLDRALYSTDASVYQIVPLGVVLPRTEADVVATWKVCRQLDVPLTARGGGTSQAGQCIGPGIILDCSKYLNHIVEIHAAERWARVQPGCVLDELNQHVKSLGLQFAPDISTANRATIGGMIANNSSGTHSLLYGKTIDHVLELKVLLADGTMAHLRPLDEAELEAKCRQQDLEGEGYRTVLRLAAEHADEIERRFPKILRRVGGYNLDWFRRAELRKEPGYVGAETRPLTRLGSPQDSPNLFNLAHLFVGSEGTLGLVLEAKLRLVALPKAKAVLVIQFRDLLEALAATPPILTHWPAAVEVMDKYILDSTKLNPEAARLRDFVQGDPAAILIVEFYGDRAEDLPGRIEALEADLRQEGFGNHYHRAFEAPAQARIWKLRTLALGLSMAEKGDAKAISFVEDSAVDPNHLRDYIAEFLDIIARHGTTAGVYAHASVGCLHVRPVINLKTVEGVRRFQAIADDVSDLVLQYGGALSGEHGDGLVRSPFQEKMFGPVLYQAFRQIKQAFDPHNLFNPGKIVDAPPLASNLRFGPAYVTAEVPTTFDFTAEGGLARAAELCAGVGECRKRRGGTMCPSYRATCEEQHSTRGRANALRLALTGQLGLAGLTDPAVKKVFDLCLECKACKSECPTNVDMARLKAEVLHQYFQKHGLPWRNWLFGNIRRLAAWGSTFPRLFNWMMRHPFVRLLNDRLLGIDRRRRPPALARRALGKQVPKDAGRFSRQVLLFPDTFVTYYEPDLARMMAELLGRAGWNLVYGFPEALGGYSLRCCGRPLISNGMLDEAVKNAAHNVRGLYPWAAQGRPILACEPSCILTIKDDYPALLRGQMRRKAEVVARQCQTFDEFFLGRAGGVSPLMTDFRSMASNNQEADAPRLPKKVLVQAHCHERSLVGVEATLRLLRGIPGAEVIDLDAGCCGLAGSFGYEKEHYDISRLVGEQGLFPAIRQADAQTMIVASGFSCRLQIEHFTGRKATHPAELLWRLLTPDKPSSP